MSEARGDEKQRPPARKGRSMLGPVILITAGILLLLNNLGLLPHLNWAAALRLWPLLLVFIGLNIIVRQAARPVGTVLSLLVALATVAVFGAVLLFAEDIPIMGRLVQEARASQRIAIPRNDVAAARLFLDGSSRPMRLARLEDSDNLLEGLLPGGQRHVDISIEDNVAVIRLDADSPADFSFGFLFDPASWGDDVATRVDLRASDRLPLDVRLDVASGPVELDLAELTIANVEIDGGSGPLTMKMPAGNYELEVDVASGPVTVELLEAGRIDMRVEGGSGPVTVALPAGAAVQLEVTDRGSGAVNVDYPNLLPIRESDEGEGVWETPGFDDADSQVTLQVDVQSGPIRLVER